MKNRKNLPGCEFPSEPLGTCSAEELDAEINAIPIRMTPEDQDCFVEAILNPPPIAPALTRAFERHQALVGSPVIHGENCPKKAHIVTGHLHGEDDDSPYLVDGVYYCGRCHTAL
jgi:hypothetical protein